MKTEEILDQILTCRKSGKESDQRISENDLFEYLYKKPPSTIYGEDGKVQFQNPDKVERNRYDLAMELYNKATL